MLDLNNNLIILLITFEMNDVELIRLNLRDEKDDV
jgi:hypothetical protein